MKNNIRLFSLYTKLPNMLAKKILLNERTKKIRTTERGRYAQSTRNLILNLNFINILISLCLHKSRPKHLLVQFNFVTFRSFFGVISTDTSGKLPCQMLGKAEPSVFLDCLLLKQISSTLKFCHLNIFCLLEALFATEGATECYFVALSFV